MGKQGSNIFHLRYYDEVYHPDHLKRGLRGWFVVVLNWMRWRLETFIQGQMIRFFTQYGSIPKNQKKSLLDTFRLDVQAEKLQKERTSPLRELVEQPETPRTRAERYTEGRKATMLEDLQPPGEDNPLRPKSLDNLIGQYAFDGRAKKYAHGRRFLADPEGDFEPVEEASRGVETALGNRNSPSVGSGGSGGNPVVYRKEVAEG